MHEQAIIGARIRALRKWRGMTLTALAQQAGVSKSYLSMAERGQRAIDRRSHIAAIAAALRVSERELVGGPHLGRNPAQTAPHRYVPALRSVLEVGPGDAPVVDRARPLDELVALMGGVVEQQRRRYAYDKVGERLPDLIDELHFHVHSPASDELAQRRALETLVEAYMCGAGMARTLGHPDLGQIAAMRADEAAVLLDDPVARGKAAFSLHRVNGTNPARVQALAERAADVLEPHARDGLGLQVLGMLTLNAALASAAALDTASAMAWLTEAERLARRVADDLESNWQAFSRTNVGVWRVAIGVELGEAGAAVQRLAERVDQTKLQRHPGRWACFLADVGRGLARERRSHAEAAAWLRRAERVAPQRVLNDAKVREVVLVMLEQARAEAGRELRGMAARMGLPH